MGPSHESLSRCFFLLLSAISRARRPGSKWGARLRPRTHGGVRPLPRGGWRKGNSTSFGEQRLKRIPRSTTMAVLALYTTALSEGDLRADKALRVMSGPRPRTIYRRTGNRSAGEGEKRSGAKSGPPQGAAWVCEESVPRPGAGPMPPHRGGCLPMTSPPELAGWALADSATISILPRDVSSAAQVDAAIRLRVWSPSAAQAGALLEPCPEVVGQRASLAKRAPTREDAGVGTPSVGGESEA